MYTLHYRHPLHPRHVRRQRLLPSLSCHTSQYACAHSRKTSCDQEPSNVDYRADITWLLWASDSFIPSSNAGAAVITQLFSLSRLRSTPHHLAFSHVFRSTSSRRCLSKDSVHHSNGPVGLSKLLAWCQDQWPSGRSGQSDRYLDPVRKSGWPRCGGPS